MKILNASQLSELDDYSCKEQEISSWELMERASHLAYKAIIESINHENETFRILAGPGNNGGDGLAIAYFLHRDGYDVKVDLINYTKTRSDDNRKNLDRLLSKSNCEINHVNSDSKLPEFKASEIVIDSIFGVGLNRPMPEFVQELVRVVNSSANEVISIDVPSGMYLNKTPSQAEEVIQADLTLSFQTPKLSFYFPDYEVYIGKTKLIDIGLSQNKLEEISTDFYALDLTLAKRFYQPRKRFSHKGTYGHAVIVGGSQNMIGSVLLASKSCLRSGVGKLSVMMPSIGHMSLNQFVPEAMCIPNTLDHDISSAELNFDPNAVGIGIGLSCSNHAYQALKSWLKQIDSPVVIDADALNLIAKHKELEKLVPKQSILTPHPGELKRLLGEWSDDFDKLEKIKALSKRLDVIVLAKDAYSLCVYRNSVYVNCSGNSGMATAGSGDVLTGLLTGLVAQGYMPYSAAIFGMFLHGLAGDIASKKMSEESLIATDLIDAIGDSFLKLQD
ncbi:bifunctional ADP-dependent NAD(P)H-hydrate dehydratase/NAD(P)H-hydrate epimerase [Psychroflexus tropicus]|uniref:bifunctional ADP-dependent NAD(P)H-hydrate dehydratase/NAD(P)H-hydrate epimerase n=1 Tax=Psychroflexus tropicus TaxID=197345 RepID=UPI0003724643|nr:bifunctional ADP-dependent NAD(P)H-hydrate dehydratase/NAD(P)H-hydrate epimerase [Psychroflexus tropicus]